MIRRFLAVMIVIGLTLSFFKRIFWIVVGILVLLWLIRLIADLFWWGKDNDKW